MDLRAGIHAGAESPFVSTGELPRAELVRQLVAKAHERYRADDDGATSQVYPALARVRADLFGICVARITGILHTAGDAEAELTIMSVAKPFVHALVCERLGREELRRRAGVNATGLPFNSLAAVERSGDGRTFAPLLDEAGNSVKGQLAAAFLSRRLGLDLVRSSPAR
jgi:glutaminase